MSSWKSLHAIVNTHSWTELACRRIQFMLPDPWLWLFFLDFRYIWHEFEVLSRRTCGMFLISNTPILFQMHFTWRLKIAKSSRAMCCSLHFGSLQQELSLVLLWPSFSCILISRQGRSCRLDSRLCLGTELPLPFLPIWLDHCCSCSSITGGW